MINSIISGLNIGTLTLDECQQLLAETKRRIGIINGWKAPFEARLDANMKAYLEANGETIDLSSIPNHNTRLRLQKYLFFSRSVVLLNQQQTALEKRIEDIQTIFKVSVEK